MVTEKKKQSGKPSRNGQIAEAIPPPMAASFGRELRSGAVAGVLLEEKKGCRKDIRRPSEQAGTVAGLPQDVQKHGLQAMASRDEVEVEYGRRGENPSGAALRVCSKRLTRSERVLMTDTQEPEQTGSESIPLVVENVTRRLDKKSSLNKDLNVGNVPAASGGELDISEKLTKKVSAKVVSVQRPGLRRIGGVDVTTSNTVDLETCTVNVPLGNESIKRPGNTETDPESDRQLFEVDLGGDNMDGPHSFLRNVHFEINANRESLAPEKLKKANKSTECFGKPEKLVGLDVNNEREIPVRKETPRVLGEKAQKRFKFKRKVMVRLTRGMRERGLTNDMPGGEDEVELDGGSEAQSVEKPVGIGTEEATKFAAGRMSTMSKGKGSTLTPENTVVQKLNFKLTGQLEVGSFKRPRDMDTGSKSNCQLIEGDLGGDNMGVPKSFSKTVHTEANANRESLAPWKFKRPRKMTESSGKPDQLLESVVNNDHEFTPVAVEKGALRASCEEAQKHLKFKRKVMVRLTRGMRERGLTSDMPGGDDEIEMDGGSEAQSVEKPVGIGAEEATKVVAGRMSTMSKGKGSALTPESIVVQRFNSRFTGRLDQASFKRPGNMDTGSELDRQLIEGDLGGDNMEVSKSVLRNVDIEANANREPLAPGKFKRPRKVTECSGKPDNMLDLVVNNEQGDSPVAVEKEFRWASDEEAKKHLKFKRKVMVRLTRGMRERGLTSDMPGSDDEIERDGGSEVQSVEKQEGIGAKEATKIVGGRMSTISRGKGSAFALAGTEVQNSNPKPMGRLTRGRMERGSASDILVGDNGVENTGKTEMLSVKKPTFIGSKNITKLVRGGITMGPKGKRPPPYPVVADKVRIKPKIMGRLTRGMKEREVANDLPGADDEMEIDGGPQLNLVERPAEVGLEVDNEVEAAGLAEGWPGNRSAPVMIAAVDAIEAENLSANGSGTDSDKVVGVMSQMVATPSGRKFRKGSQRRNFRRSSLQSNERGGRSVEEMVTTRVTRGMMGRGVMSDSPPAGGFLAPRDKADEGARTESDARLFVQPQDLLVVAEEQNREGDSTEAFSLAGTIFAGGCDKDSLKTKVDLRTLQIGSTKASAVAEICTRSRHTKEMAHGVQPVTDKIARVGKQKALADDQSRPVINISTGHRADEGPNKPCVKPRQAFVERFTRSRKERAPLTDSFTGLKSAKGSTGRMENVAEKTMTVLKGTGLSASPAGVNVESPLNSEAQDKTRTDPVPEVIADVVAEKVRYGRNGKSAAIELSTDIVVGLNLDHAIQQQIHVPGVVMGALNACDAAVPSNKSLKLDATQDSMNIPIRVKQVSRGTHFEGVLVLEGYKMDTVERRKNKRRLIDEGSEVGADEVQRRDRASKKPKVVGRFTRGRNGKRGKHSGDTVVQLGRIRKRKSKQSGDDVPQAVIVETAINQNVDDIVRDEIPVVSLQGVEHVEIVGNSQFIHDTEVGVTKSRDVQEETIVAEIASLITSAIEAQPLQDCVEDVAASVAEDSDVLKPVDTFSESTDAAQRSEAEDCTGRKGSVKNVTFDKEMGFTKQKEGKMDSQRTISDAHDTGSNACEGAKGEAKKHLREKSGDGLDTLLDQVRVEVAWPTEPGKVSSAHEIFATDSQQTTTGEDFEAGVNCQLFQAVRITPELPSLNGRKKDDGVQPQKQVWVRGDRRLDKEAVPECFAPLLTRLRGNPVCSETDTEQVVDLGGNTMNWKDDSAVKSSMLNSQKTRQEPVDSRAKRGGTSQTLEMARTEVPSEVDGSDGRCQEEALEAENVPLSVPNPAHIVENVINADPLTDKDKVQGNGRKESLQGLEELCYQDLLLHFLQDGLPGGDSQQLLSKIQTGPEPVGETGLKSLQEVEFVLNDAATYPKEDISGTSSGIFADSVSGMGKEESDLPKYRKASNSHTRRERQKTVREEAQCSSGKLLKNSQLHGESLDKIPNVDFVANTAAGREGMDVAVSGPWREEIQTLSDTADVDHFRPELEISGTSHSQGQNLFTKVSKQTDFPGSDLEGIVERRMGDSLYPSSQDANAGTPTGSVVLEETTHSSGAALPVFSFTSLLEGALQATLDEPLSGSSAQSKTQRETPGQEEETGIPQRVILTRGELNGLPPLVERERSGYLCKLSSRGQYVEGGSPSTLQHITANSCPLGNLFEEEIVADSASRQLTSDEEALALGRTVQMSFNSSHTELILGEEETVNMQGEALLNEDISAAEGALITLKSSDLTDRDGNAHSVNELMEGNVILKADRTDLVVRLEVGTGYLGVEAYGSSPSDVDIQDEGAVSDQKRNVEPTSIKCSSLGQCEALLLASEAKLMDELILDKSKRLSLLLDGDAIEPVVCNEPEGTEVFEESVLLQDELVGHGCSTEDISEGEVRFSLPILKEKPVHAKVLSMLGCSTKRLSSVGGNKVDCHPLGSEAEEVSSPPEGTLQTDVLPAAELISSNEERSVEGKFDAVPMKDSSQQGGYTQREVVRGSISEVWEGVLSITPDSTLVDVDVESGCQRRDAASSKVSASQPDNGQHGYDSSIWVEKMVGDKVSNVSFSMLLQAELGEPLVEAGAIDTSFLPVEDNHIDEEAHATLVYSKGGYAEVEEGVEFVLAEANTDLSPSSAAHEGGDLQAMAVLVEEKVVNTGISPPEPLEQILTAEIISRMEMLEPSGADVDSNAKVLQQEVSVAGSLISPVEEEQNVYLEDSVHEDVDHLALNLTICPSDATFEGQDRNPEGDPNLELSNSSPLCVNDVMESLDATIAETTPQQNVKDQTEGLEELVEEDQRDTVPDAQVTDELKSSEDTTTEEHLMETTIASSHVNKDLFVTLNNAISSEIHRVILAEEVHASIAWEKSLSAPLEVEISNEIVKQTPLKQHQGHNASAGEVTEKHIEELPHISNLALKEVQVTDDNPSGSESVTTEVVVADAPGNEEEIRLEGLIGEVINDGTDLDHPTVQTEQPLSTVSKPGSMSFLDSDATASESLESTKVMTAACGPSSSQEREVQSPLEKMLNEKHVGLPDIMPHSEEQQYVANTTRMSLNQQPVGTELRMYKKKGKSCGRNQERHFKGTGTLEASHCGLKRKRHLQNSGLRHRRLRPIDPEQQVMVFVEGRDTEFQEDGGAFFRWLRLQDEGNTSMSSGTGALQKSATLATKKSSIVIPSFRVVADYEERQQQLEKQKQAELGQQKVVCSKTVRPSDYDMDDEDEKWLHAWNQRLSQAGVQESISEDKFEEIIEYLERKSAQLSKASVAAPLAFPYVQKSVSSLPNNTLLGSPAGLGPRNPISLALAIAAPANAPIAYPPILRPVNTAWSRGYKDTHNFGRKTVAHPSIQNESAVIDFTSPASTVQGHTGTPANERDSRPLMVETVVEGSSERSFDTPPQKASDDCCICNGGEDSENNPVYTCKQCLIYVHQSCYGIREKFRDDHGWVIAPPNWCCRKCEAVAAGTAERNVGCALCRKKGGALKPTVEPQKWAHVACALYTNETYFVDPDAMEPIDGVTAVEARIEKRQYRCSLCGVRKGTCSICSVKGCGAPFHISCGIRQGASFELRHSKQKVIGVRAFCSRHARTTPIDALPPAGVKENFLLTSSTSGAAASATATGSISTASSVEHKEVGSAWQRTSHTDRCLIDSPCPAGDVNEEVADLGGQQIGCTKEKGLLGTDRGQAQGSPFEESVPFRNIPPLHRRGKVSNPSILKQKWGEPAAQASDEGLLVSFEEQSVNRVNLHVEDTEAQVGTNQGGTWHVVGPGHTIKRIRFKIGSHTEVLNSESSPGPAQHDAVVQMQPEIMKEPAVTVGQVASNEAEEDGAVTFLSDLTENRFANEVNELIILEEAMKSDVAPSHIMRDAFVYWRAKRARHNGSLLCNLQHEQWYKSQGIFNKDLNAPPQPSDPPAQQVMDKTMQFRRQLELVRSMTQIVVEREKLKYQEQIVLGNMTSVELNMAQSQSGDYHCLWCPSTRSLLSCATCPRSFCFNCFKHRKGFGVKGWVAAVKQPLYSCNFCRESLIGFSQFPDFLDPTSTRLGEDGATGSLLNASKSGGKVKGKGKGTGKGNCEGKGLGWKRSSNPVPIVPVSGAEQLCNPIAEIDKEKVNQPEIFLKAGLNDADSLPEPSSFEDTLRRLNILPSTGVNASQEPTSTSVPPAPNTANSTPDLNATRRSSDIHERPKKGGAIGGRGLLFPTSAPALMVYKKKEKTCTEHGTTNNEAPSVYDFHDKVMEPPSHARATSGIAESDSSPSSRERIIKLSELRDTTALGQSPTD